MPDTNSPGSPSVGSPNFCHRESVLQGRDRLFEVFQLPDARLARPLFATLLVENANVLLTGTCGTGKKQLVHLVRKLLFSDGKGGSDYASEICHQELSALEVLYRLDLAQLRRGREVVHPRKMVTARLKFLSEIQRANTSFLTSLLQLLSMRRVTYGDLEREIPGFLCFMDRNPLDSGSNEIPEAFLDCVDFSFEIAAIHLDENRRLVDLRRGSSGFVWTGIEELVTPALAFEQLFEVWQDVKRVEIPPRAALLAGMVTDAFRLCIVAERSTARMEFDLSCSDCQFKGEICSHLLKVPGERVTNSLFRLAQALAWVDGLSEVREEHLFAALPWCLSHRLAIRPEELRKSPNEQEWLQEVALGQILGPRLSNWARALCVFDAGDLNELEKLGQNDLVVRELLLMAEESLERQTRCVDSKENAVVNRGKLGDVDSQRAAAGLAARRSLRE